MIAINSYLTALTYFLAVTAVVLFSTFVFDRITLYTVWEEIHRGNIAVALATGGNIIGVANIMHFAIRANDTLLQTLTWGGLGALALLLVYLAFEVLTPKLAVSEEIGKGNIAVGFLSCAYSIAFSLVIGASIT